ncbi:MAG: phosphoglycerate transporter [Deltaproteobacteria bacterium]|nr:phosphoglycerate transporter [Deltaproteobacteria bacterium]
MLYQIGWFSTGRGPGSRNLLKTILENIASGIINAKISFVFCSREEGEAEGSDLYLKMVKDQGLNLISFSSRKFKPEMRKQGKDDPNIMRQWRIEYDRKIMSLLNHHSADVNVLAGYMLIVGDEMCEKYNLINLHPAAPDGPAGTWQEVIWRLIEDRANQSGVMIHLVTNELDKGPRITYCTFPLKDPFIDPLWEKHEQKLKSKSLNQIIKEEGKNNELFKEIRKMGVIRELPLVVQTLKIFSEGKIGIKDKHIIVNDRIQHQPYCLTEQIEAFIKD